MEALGLTVIRKPWTEKDLTALNIQPDITVPEGIGYTHRHGKDADIYFICNPTEKEMTFAPKFRATGKNKYIADPMDGKIYNGTDNMTLNPGASAFVILTNMTLDAEEKVNIRQTIPLKTKEWTITFDETGKNVTAKELFDWSSSTDNSIKYYSGHATYETTFKHNGKNKGRVMLDLGKVENIATVYVNGKKCGTAWLAPYTVDITDAVKKGKNTLRIEVVNTWANALLGNDNGTAPFEGIWTNGKYRRAEKTTLPAGLLGPIKIMKNEE